MFINKRVNVIFTKFHITILYRFVIVLCGSDLTDGFLTDFRILLLDEVIKLQDVIQFLVLAKTESIGIVFGQIETTAKMETGLRNLGFLPVEPGKAAKDDDNYRIFDPATKNRKEGKDSPLYMQHNVEFSITKFTGLLWSLYDGQKSTVENFIATFKITAIDAGGSTVKEVKFEMVCE